MTTVYFAGGEDTSFIAGVYTISTTAALRRSAFSRAVIEFFGGGSTFPLVNYVTTPTFTSISTCWVHGQFSVTGNASTSADFIAVALLDPTGVPRLMVVGTGTTGQLAIAKRTSAGVYTTLATTAANVYGITASGVPVAFDFFVNYGTSGQATLYLNGINVADTGPGVDVTTNGATQLNQLIVSMPQPNTSNTFCWSEIIVQDTSTLGAALFTIPPVASGNTQSWTPNTVANINPSTINDANFVSTASNNALSEWTVATSLPSGSWAIEAVVQEARVDVGGSGPQHFGWVVRTSDGSDHTTGTLAPLIGSFSNFANQIWPTNPHTSSAWNAGELINAGIESLA